MVVYIVDIPYVSYCYHHRRPRGFYNRNILSRFVIIIITTAALLIKIATRTSPTIMVAAFSSAVVQSFASKPFVQRALENVCKPSSVLSFWFGVDASTPEGQECLRTGSKQCVSDMAPLWYTGGSDYDQLCQPFADVVHKAGTGVLPKDDAGWYTTVDGNVAQVVVVDQLARNIFRGTRDAFRYEAVALDIARQLSTQYLRKHPASTCAALLEQIHEPSKSNLVFDDIDEKLYPPYCTVIATALMHSEVASDHVLSVALIEHSQNLAEKGINEADDTNKLLFDWFKYQLVFAIDHKNVIDRFGRYPHRNRILNRTSTQLELDWLSDTDSLPGWAKSQG
jgi:uncharacterized protein (DUF924 family)